MHSLRTGPSSELVLVAPVWKARSRYPVLLEMLVDMIPHRGNLITATHEDSLLEVVP